MAAVVNRRRPHLFAGPRKLEAFCEREYGRDVLENMHVCSNGLAVPVPIMGVAAAAYRGTIVPRTAPNLSALWRRNFRHAIAGERGGFASLADLISEATSGGKAQDITFYKTGAAPGATAGTSPLWNVGNVPGAGGVGGTSGTGAVPARNATGALAQTNAAGGDTLHLTTAKVLSTVAGCLMLYDRLWHMTYNHASSTSTSVDSANRPSRYQGSSTAPGNFLTHEVTTVMSATAHTLTVTYVDDQGNTAEAGSAKAIRVSSAVQTILWTAPEWTYTLNSGDRGLRYITVQAQSTTASVTGVSSAVIGHPLALIPIPVANIGCVLDGVNSAFNLVQIQDDACLSMMDFQKSANTAATLQGIIKLVSG